MRCGSKDWTDNLQTEEEGLSISDHTQFNSFSSPNGVEYEEELDEYAAKRQNSSHNNTRERLCVE